MIKQKDIIELSFWLKWINLYHLRKIQVTMTSYQINSTSNIILFYKATKVLNGQIHNQLYFPKKTSLMLCLILRCIIINSGNLQDNGHQLRSIFLTHIRIYGGCLCHHHYLQDLTNTIISELILEVNKRVCVSMLDREISQCFTAVLTELCQLVIRKEVQRS